MWIRNEDRNGQKVLDEVEIDGTIWVEIADGKGDEDVLAENRRKTCKKIVSTQDEFCESGNEQTYDTNG